MKTINLLLVTCVLVSVLGCESKESQPAAARGSDTPELSSEEVTAIAKDAYIYGFPMVMGYKTMYAYAIDQDNGDYK